MRAGTELPLRALLAPQGASLVARALLGGVNMLMVGCFTVCYLNCCKTQSRRCRLLIAGLPHEWVMFAARQLGFAVQYSVSLGVEDTVQFITDSITINNKTRFTV